MKVGKVSWFCVLFVVFFAHVAIGKTIYSKHFKFKVEIPVTFIKVTDTTGTVEGEVYFDTNEKIVLLVTKAESKYKSVKDYLDCSRVQLENELRISYADTGLHLVSCNRSPSYTDKIVVLNIEITVLPSVYKQSVIYFIHHKGNDVQFSFMIRKEQAAHCLPIIQEVMKTLELI